VTVVAGLGITVGAADGWDLRISRRPAVAPERTHAVLHAATFALPADRAALGDYGDGAVQLMSADDVFVALVEFGAQAARTALFRAVGLPQQLAPGAVSRTTLQHARAGQAGIQRFFSEQGRGWCLYVVVGAYDRRTRLVPRANALLRTIEIA
jgi:hypothetical protein